MEGEESPPLIDRADLKMQADLAQPSIQDVMLEFGRRIWKKGFNCCLDMVMMELRAVNNHEAADLVSKMRKP